MLRSMLSMCPCVCVEGGYPWGHMGDTSESSLLPKGPVKMQREGSLVTVFDPFNQVVLLTPIVQHRKEAKELLKDLPL